MVLFFDSPFRTPRAFRFDAPSPAPSPAYPFALFATEASSIHFDNGTIQAFPQDGLVRRAEEHPPLGYLTLLVFEAVLEVVCVSLPGYIIARRGMFNTEMQKFVANLNVSLFTPCLIFTKLASQLTLSKIVELATIPILFGIMTMVSFGCAIFICRLFGLKKRAKNFVTAMAVFGNSNSLPMSLVVSLSRTITGLHWDRIPGDNDDDVAARGILYLLIFQQLGQLLRWSWGYHVLLAAPGKDSEGDDGLPRPVVEVERYRDNSEENSEADISESDMECGTRVDPFLHPQFANSYQGLHQEDQEDSLRFATKYSSAYTSEAPSGSQTPVNAYPVTSSVASISSRPVSPGGHLAVYQSTRREQQEEIVPPLNGNITSFPSIASRTRPPLQSTSKFSLPPAISKFLKPVTKFLAKVYKTFMAVMNPPLWAMLIAVIIASVPKLQKLFFTPGTFIQNSVSRAASQSGDVAVPLILVVLGANLGNSTTKKVEDSEHSTSRAKARHENKLLFASLISRMLLPYIVMAPLLALAAKYLPISILDDPIFVVVCFLLIGAPSALQLAQICQINGVYEDVMARILFWSYVTVILPSTLLLVITAIQVVKWAV